MAMKYLVTAVGMLIVMAGHGQTIIGTWQQSDEKTCIQSQTKESETEKELLPLMGASTTSVAKLISFDTKGKGKEGIFSTGVKKGSNMNDFQYKVSGQELQFLDKKSGIITQRFVIDSLTESTLAIHNAMKDCEARIFTRVK
jgi:hypothetical protein